MEHSNRHVALINLYQVEVQAFLGEADFHGESLTRLMTHLVAALIDYRIEGISYFPVVYLFDSLDPLQEILGTHQRIRLGFSDSPGEAAEEILLKGAPLSTDRWKIYIHPTEKGFEYGIFNGIELPVGHEPRHVLVSHEQQKIRVIKVARIANRCLEFESNIASTRRFFFSADNDIRQSPYELVNRIASAAVADAPEGIRSHLREYLFGAIKRGILGSHGALIAVVCHDQTDLPRCFTDAVRPDPPVNMATTMEHYLFPGKLTDFHTLEALSELLTGVLNSDGIMILRSDGVLLAYRAFCSLDMNGGPVHGGARKRAFEAMKREILRGSSLIAAFIHTQDGWMDTVEA